MDRVVDFFEELMIKRNKVKNKLRAIILLKHFITWTDKSNGPLFFQLSMPAAA